MPFCILISTIPNRTIDDNEIIPPRDPERKTFGHQSCSGRDAVRTCPWA